MNVFLDFRILLFNIIYFRYCFVLKITLSTVSLMFLIILTSGQVTNRVYETVTQVVAFFV